LIRGAATSPRPEQNEMPMLHEVLNRAASHFDEVVTSALLHRRTRSPADVQAESLNHRERLKVLGQLARLYDRPEHFDEDGSFFPAARAISPALRRVRRMAGGEVLDAIWPSGFSPHCGEVTDRYLEHGPNRLAAARLFLHKGPPRPVVFLIHGYRCGQYAFEERVWPIDWLFKGGVDIALPVLPFHAVRAAGSVRFPSSDLRVTIEGFRQAVRDLGALSQFFRERGAPSVGVMGMSLGGYVSSLLATLDARLGFAIPIIPLASLSAVARQNGRFVGSEAEQQLQFEAVERVYRVVSPLSRPSRVDKDRVLVIGAAGDRITPIEHAQLLAKHFQAPLSVFPGGHLLQFGRAQGFRAAGEMLQRIGVLSKAR
jgi:pimeloyl-ACP methyl ester carboxylesterase